MTCLIHVYYCFVVLVTVPDTLSTMVLHVYAVTLPGRCYTFCYSTLLCISCIVMFHIFFVHTPYLYTHDTITRLFMFHTNTVRLLLLYPQSCHLYTLLHFLIFVTLHVVTHSCICTLYIAYIRCSLHYCICTTQSYGYVAYCTLHICMFISIICIISNWILLSHDLMITC